MWQSKCRAILYVVALHWLTPPPNQKAIQCVMILFSAYGQSGERAAMTSQSVAAREKDVPVTLTLAGAFSHM